MEIPTVRSGLYQQDLKKFSQQLAEALETFGVVQIDGVEQQLVDDFYDKIKEYYAQSSEPPAKVFNCSNYKGNGFYETTLFPPLAIPELDQSIEKVRKNISSLADQVDAAITSHYGLPSKMMRKGMRIKRYFKGPELDISSSNAKNNILEGHHDLNFITMAPSASVPGLEGLIDGRWLPLQAERGHLLAWAANKMTTHCGIKSFLHRVPFLDSERYSMIYY